MEPPTLMGVNPKKVIRRTALVPIIEREIALRNDDRGEGGIDQLCLEIAASGRMTQEGAQRRIYTIRSGVARRADGTTYKQRWLEIETVDKMLAALDLEHLWHLEPGLRGRAPRAVLRCHDCRCEITPETGYRSMELMRRKSKARAGKRARHGGRRFQRFDLCEACAEAAIAGTQKKQPPKRGGRPRLLTDRQICAAHVIYVREQLSMPEIADRLLAAGKKGTRAGLTSALLLGFRRLGLPVRGRSEAHRVAHHNRGRIPFVNPVCEGSKRSGEPCTAKAKKGHALCVSHLRFGSGAPKMCAGVKQWAPRKGSPCRNHAADDSDFCRRHDPRYRFERAARLAELRSRIGATELREAA